jgi:hypothetical protein
VRARRRGERERGGREEVKKSTFEKIQVMYEEI